MTLWGKRCGPGPLGIDAHMIVGVPKEIKQGENRVAVTGAGVKALGEAGHQVFVEAGAGLGSGIREEEYRRVGAEVIGTARELFARADLIAKVKEPLPQELPFLREGQILFTYLHLAADSALTRALCERGIVGIGYETVQRADGSLPLLTPMSEVAGRLAIQVGAHYLERVQGGRGVLLSGVPGVPPANVMIVGGGTVGINAAKVAVGMGADVAILDVNVDRLRYLDDLFRGHVVTLVSNSFNIAEAVRRADLLVGAVLVAGARAPKVVTRSMIASMKEGTVAVDVAVDQGGCLETTRPTSHADPVYVVDGVIHYCVTNMPGMVPRTSTMALTNATLPYILELANKGVVKAIMEDPALARGVNLWRGEVVHPGVAEATGLPCASLDDILKRG